MTVREVVHIFGYVILDKPENAKLGDIVFVTDKEGTYTLLVDKILNGEKIICKIYGGRENESVL